MFCSQCGTAIDSGDKFCGKCGKAILVAGDQTTVATVASTQMPNFGTPNARWWYGINGVQPFPSPYGWFYQVNTLLVFDKYLALIPGKKEQSEIGEFFASGVGFGVFGLVTGAIGSVAMDIKNRLDKKSAGLDSEKAASLFELGTFVWCKKEDAEIWQVKGKKNWLGKEPAPSSVLACSFNSKLGPLPHVFRLVNTDVPMFARDHIGDIGCRIVVKANGLTDDETKKVFSDFFKDLPRKT
jgi:hypothetical protein